MKKLTIREMIIISLAAAIIAVCSNIAIPLAIPVTLQTMAVCTIAGLFGAKIGTLSVLVYLALGLVGIPVFSGFRAGFSALFGITGGYLIGFLLTAFIVGHFSNRTEQIKISFILPLLLGTVLCYAFGTVWYAVIYAKGAVGLSAALAACVIPYLLPEAAKLAFSLLLIIRLRPLVLKKLR